MILSDEPDVIVVGAGPAGCTAAYALAKSGMDVTLVERGEKTGDKNVSGGVLFGRVLHRLIPRFWEEAPIERIIRTHRVSMVDNKASLTVDYTDESLAEEPYNAFSIIRADFDRWFASKAEDAGALLANGVRVDGVVKKNGRVVGIRSGDEIVRSKVVIAADGVNSLVAEDAGLRKRPTDQQVALGIKEVYGLSEEAINERFGLLGNDGVAHSFLGATEGIPGGGFLYTNRASISVGVVVLLTGFQRSKIDSREIIDRFTSTPIVRRAIRDGLLLEYSAHLVPEGGYSAIRQLSDDGILVVGDAAGLVLNLGFSFEGMNYAIGSGMAAAKAILKAHKKNDFSKGSLREYDCILQRNFMLKDFKTYKGLTKVFGNPRLYSDYPEVIMHLARDSFISDLVPRQRLVTRAIFKFLSDIPLPHLIKDGLELIRGL
ncbi:FAD-dependent oxidoreductase [Candidatus Thorarchaeota archaeon]|nr:MAG: FAD-dependent oxidoreductase [Candidatus Thorarchaeota archaeon]